MNLLKLLVSLDSGWPSLHMMKGNILRRIWLATRFHSWKLIGSKPCSVMTDSSSVPCKQQRSLAVLFMSWISPRRDWWKFIWAEVLVFLLLRSQPELDWFSSLTPWHFLLLDLYVCGKMLHCFMLALWPGTPRGRRAPSFTLLRVNCSDRALRGPSLALCPLRSKEAALILPALLSLAT